MLSNDLKSKNKTGNANSVARKVEKEAISREDKSFTFFTRFAAKPYDSADIIMSNEKWDDSDGLKIFDKPIKIIIPIKPIKRPEMLSKLKICFLNKRKEIINVNKGIVPINVEATTLST